MAHLQSSQNFVRALKATSDPPNPGDPSKVEIAREAWDSPSFHIPNKGETIVDWALTKLLKDRTRDAYSIEHRASNPILDLRYWELLADILYPRNTAQTFNDYARLHKTWLHPLLSRIPIAPIVISLLNLSTTLDDDARTHIYSISCRSISLLWPLAVAKITPDTLLDCFGALLGSLASHDTLRKLLAEDGLRKIGNLITASFRIAFSNSSNKKKLHQTFVQHHLETWLRTISAMHLVTNTTPQSSLLPEIYMAGVDLIFNLDALRQLSDPNTSSLLFIPLQSFALTSPTSVLPSLPRLLVSFTQAVRRHRSALFGPGDASAVDARASSVKCFAAFEQALRNIQDGEEALVWKTRLNVLEVVEGEKLFDTGSGDIGALLQEDIELAITALDRAREGKAPFFINKRKASHHDIQDSRNTQTDLAIGVLSIITRMDHDMIDPSISRILPKFLSLPQSSPTTTSAEHTTSASQLLLLLLSHHAKTRTLPIHIGRLLTALTPPFPLAPSSSLRLTYKDFTASPLLDPLHLEKLSKSVHAFLTPGQAHGTALDVFRALQRIWEGFSEAYKTSLANDGTGARKKRRISDRPSDQQSGQVKDAEPWAISFALAARIVSSVITAVPINSVTADVQEELRAVIGDALDGFLGQAVQMSLDKVDRAEEGGESGTDDWAVQVVGAAALRLKYAIEVAGDLRVVAQAGGDVGRMVTAVKSAEILPELQIEFFRTLFGQAIEPSFNYRDTVTDAALTYLERYLSSYNLDSASWPGRSSQLEFEGDGRIFAAVGLLRLVLDRWLAVIEIYGFAAQRERLMEILFSISSNLSSIAPSGLLMPTSILLEALRSADFWEKVNIRAALLATVNSRTSALDGVDVAQALSQTGKKRKKSSTNTHATEDQIRKAEGAYKFLLYAPNEYLTRSSRSDLLKRAIALDVVLGVSPRPETESIIIATRAFLLRIFTFMGTADHPIVQWIAEYLQHIFESTSSFKSSDSTSVTLDLVQLHLLSMLRMAEKGEEDAIVDTVKRLIELPFDFEGSAVVSRLSILRLMNLLTSDFSTAAFSPNVLASFKALYEHVLEKVQTVMQGLQNSALTVGRVDVLETWCQCIAFGKWIGSTRNPAPGLGKRLTQMIASEKLPSAKASSQKCNAVLAILLTELLCCAEADRTSQLGLIVSAYVIFFHLCEEQGRKILDESLAKICHSLSVAEFSFTLDLVLETLSIQSGVEDLTCLVHLTALLLHDAPEGTLKVVQAHLTRCLDIIVNRPVYCAGATPLLRLQVLTFINRQCSDHPASLRPVNLSAIWSLLSKFISGSESHDAETDSNTFHEITSIVGALVRLRRDLVLNTLPHLCIVLCLLIRCLRSPRPHLGAKQHKLIADTLPQWINPSHPLGADTSKALARLLTTLVTKSLVRAYTHGSATDAPKHESLARPLTKHVAYVIQAYVDALNEPLCVMPTDVRRELQPGLFILCGMLSEPGRDALMMSALDAGGKTVMKQLWKEYEKQKYVGKG
ncbi:hypothetical protein EW146_g35 [Bondarzewia mesenterica]|uniref:Nucleolar 27S pre-rRNA processing Urb2/Npa2 C-terminal domain-containing protein n=1 Tax=Bondarzewia mesenterica TaxID=1095465 RepID=A0A4S4MAJ3_9AGAM|nr:hypothetical protein EW146_g35 [Bondarzewia mesenterica]